MTLDKLILWTLGIFAAFFLVLLAASTPADAQQPRMMPIKCGNHASLMRHLETKYAERQVSTGTARGTITIEIWASPLGTFTIFMSDGKGGACILASGEKFEQIKPAPLKPENSF